MDSSTTRVVDKIHEGMLAEFEKMELEKRKFTENQLNSRSYRNLQRIAKGMGLPCMVKKTYLIELILAKQFNLPQRDLDDIMHRVQLERKQNSALKAKKYSVKRFIQASEVSSTCNTSLPITNTTITTKQPVATHNSDKQPDQLDSKEVNATTINPPPSDRVLRSSHDRPNYRAMNNAYLFNEEAASGSADPREKDLGKKARFNEITANANLSSSATNEPESSPIVPTSSNMSTPVKTRERRLSGISPLPRHNNANADRMSFVHQNGKITRLKIFVERPAGQITNACDNDRSISRQNNNAHGVNVMVRVLRNSDISNGSNNNNVLQQNNENKNITIDVMVENTQNTIQRDTVEPYIGYLGMDQQIINLKMHKVYENRDEALPDDSNILSIYNDTTTYTETEHRLLNPNYVQVDESLKSYQSSSNTITYGAMANMASTSLENLYNYNSNYVAISDNSDYLLTATNTKCVFSTKTLTTAVQQASASVIDEHSACDLATPQDNANDPNLFEFLPFNMADSALPYGGFPCNDVISTPTPLDTMPDQSGSGNVTVHEMVDDAIALISQDREYMDRIDMELGMQCFICHWAGSKCMLNNHLMENHINDIQTYETDEWITTYTLGSLLQRDVWLCRVVQYNSVLYVLSAKYEEPDIFLASISSVSAVGDTVTNVARITTFNKVTGEPYTWQGPVRELSHTMPYHNIADCFKLELSKMDLLPNSANIKLINGELVGNKPNKVVVGQPALHDIHINLFFKLYNVGTLQK